MNRKIIVFGATGNTGIKICEELSKLNMKHSAFVRKGSEGKVTNKFTEVIQGDVLVKEDVNNALSKQSFTDIIIALGSRSLKISNIRSHGTKNIIDVLNENATSSRIHVVSAHGVRDSWASLKWYEKLLSKLFLSKTLIDHEEQENLIITNSGGYHIIRPVALKNAAPTGKIHSQSEGPLPYGDITRGDVAKYLVSSILEDKTGVSSICRG